MSTLKKIYIFALAAHGEGISGSDRIFIEFAKNWSKDYSITIYVSDEGYQMCKRQNLIGPGINFQISKVASLKRLGFFLNYLTKIFMGIYLGLTLSVKEQSKVLVYSASEFWMDSVPAFLLKLRFQKLRWAAAWYQTAPHPLKGGFNQDGQIKRYPFKALVYWLVQLPIKPLIDNFADFILVNNEQEKRVFKNLNKTRVVLGALNLDKIKDWQKSLVKSIKIYDGIFQGRFHPQKGVIELIEIWSKVTKVKPDAKLAMIGDGPLMSAVRQKIKELNLENNIELFGYLFDGEKKFSIFLKSKVVVHPALYDSGGMAALEAMAFGLPCVGFNLISYKDYYPKGMIKVEVGNLEEFADKILELLKNKKLYAQISEQANDLIDYRWSWQYRSRQILSQLLK